MIVCPNCTHQNPDGATQCEACYTPLPTTISCPQCGTSVQADAGFCGQCGYNLKPMGNEGSPDPLPPIPPLDPPDPLVPPETVVTGGYAPDPYAGSGLPATVVSQETGGFDPTPTTPPRMVPDPDPFSVSAPPSPSPVAPPPDPVFTQPTPPPVAPPPDPVFTQPTPPPVSSTGHAKTQLQQQVCRLLHIQTDTTIELPQNLAVIHIGKPNDQIPPDIDVSGFPDSSIVSRIHADIRVEGDAYYIEDVGSANGTYINHTPLARGNRHKLRPGDRISLGKGDLVTFLFQVA